MPMFLYRHILFVLSVVLLVSAFSAEALEFEVTTSADSGPGSLRAAILAVNAETGGTHNIVFSGGPYQIMPTSALPAVTTPGTLTISGETCTLDGYYLAGEEDGLRIETNNCTVSGLGIQRFSGNGIYISGDGNTIRACSIGTDGNAALPNGGHGIFVFGGTANIIGGLMDADGNAICGSGGNGVLIQGPAASGNRVLNNRVGMDQNGIPRGNKWHGICLVDAQDTKVGSPSRGNWISANGKGGIFGIGNLNGTTIQGNLIGTDITGFFGEGNTECGIELTYVNGAVTVGGSGGGASNCISANTLAGIYVNISGPGIVIKGNKVGTNVQGTAPLGNLFGISVADTGGVVIGSALPGEGNLISGNSNEGIRLSGMGTTGCIIQGNSIGTSADGMSALPNEQGISILIGANNTTIGGDSVEKGNLISGNTGAGIWLSGGDRYLVQGNRIGMDGPGTGPLPNGGAGILVGNVRDSRIGGSNIIAYNLYGIQVDQPDAVHITITGKSIYANHNAGISLVAGANDAISPPAITGLGSVLGTAPPNTLVEVFADEEDEGRYSLGSTTANSRGRFSLDADLRGFMDMNLTATSTDGDGNTSAFSAAYPASGSEGEGEVLPEGEGEAPGEGEGEVLPEGEGEAPGEGEGEVLSEGEGETLDEGEGEVLPEGEGEVPSEGETEGEGETGGCLASTKKGLSPVDMLERMFGDWLLIGVTLIAFAGLAGIRQK